MFNKRPLSLGKNDCLTKRYDALNCMNFVRDVCNVPTDVLFEVQKSTWRGWNFAKSAAILLIFPASFTFKDVKK